MDTEVRMHILTEGLWRDGRQETDEASKAHEPAILVYLRVNKKKTVSNQVKEKGPHLSLFSEHRQALACMHLYPHMNTCTHAHTETERERERVHYFQISISACSSSTICPVI